MGGDDISPARPTRHSAPGRSARPARPFVVRRSAPPTAATTPRVRRDRRGRGLRTPLLPETVPAARTRAEQFDQAVLEAVADLEDRWPGRLDAIEFAVDEVPSVPPGEPVGISDDVVVDAGVPLARFLPAGIDARGRPTKARVVLYRRPLEVRSTDALDLGDLVSEVLAEQVGAILGESPPE